MDRINVVNRKTAGKKAKKLALYGTMLGALAASLYFVPPAVQNVVQEEVRTRKKTREIINLAGSDYLDIGLLTLDNLEGEGFSHKKAERIRRDVSGRIEERILEDIDRRSYTEAMAIADRYKKFLDDDAEAKLDEKIKALNPDVLLDRANQFFDSWKRDFRDYPVVLDLLKKASAGYREMGLEDKAKQKIPQYVMNLIFYSLTNSDRIQYSTAELGSLANTIKADQEMCISDSDFQGFLGIAKNYMASSREHDGKPEMVKQIFTAGPDIGCMSRDAFSKAGYLDGLLDKYRLWAASVAYTPKLNIAYKNAVAIYLIEIGETYNRNVSGMLKDIITVQG